MPIYMDEDYCFQQNRDRWLKENNINANEIKFERSSEEGSETSSQISLSLRDLDTKQTLNSIDPTLFNDYVNPTTLKKQFMNFERLQKWAGQRYVRNEITRELTMFLQNIITFPQKLETINFKKHQRVQYI